MSHESFSAQLLTDPYTALHDASAEAVEHTAGELAAIVAGALSTAPGYDTADEPDRTEALKAICTTLAPLVARYAHAITGVDTLRALLNAGKLEFNAEGTVKECRDLLAGIAVAADYGDKYTDHQLAVLAGEWATDARELLARQMDARNPMTGIAKDMAAGVVGAIPAKPGAEKDPKLYPDLKDPHAAAVAAIEATERALEAAQGNDPAVTAVLVQLARVAVEAAEAVLDDGDEAVTEARTKLNDLGLVVPDAAAPEPVLGLLHFTATRRDGEEHSATVPRSIGRGDLDPLLEAARSYGRYGWTIERGGQGDETVVGILDADGEYRHDEVADAIDVKAAGERRAEAAEAFDQAERVAAARKASAFPTPFYEVYRADVARQVPHCTTRSYQDAIAYCRAGNGTPWHVLEIGDDGEAILVTDVKIDGTVVELKAVRLPDPPAQPPEEMQEMVRDLAAKRAKPSSEEPEVWFTVMRDDRGVVGLPTAEDFCKTPHYQLALEYCQGSPGVPWRIMQHIAGANIAGDPTPPIVVTTVDEAGDVTEVGERGTS